MNLTRRRARTSVVSATLAAALALGVGACSGDEDEPSDESSPAASGAPSAPPLTTTATIGAVAGSKLPGARREALKDQVRTVVDAWVDGAYVGGSWPRTDVGTAFSGFSAGARKDAQTDLRVMSNADIGDQLTGVTAKRRDLSLDVLAVKQRAVAVTARLVLTYETTGEVTGARTVRARLFLTRGEQGWEVFGYDVAAGDGTAGSGATGQDGQKSQDKKGKKDKKKGSGR